MKKVNMEYFKYTIRSYDNIYLDLDTYKWIIESQINVTELNNKRYLKIDNLSSQQYIDLKKEYILTIKNEGVRNEFKEIDDNNFHSEFHELTVDYKLEYDWLDFEAIKLEEMAIKWCKENNIEYYFTE